MTRFAYFLLYQDFGLLILRLSVGAPMIFHGFPKLFKNFFGTAAWFDSVGFRPGKFWVLVVGVVEFFGGIALMLGFLVQPVAALVVIEMLVILIRLKWGKVKLVDAEKIGWEYELLYLASAFVILTAGAGRYVLEYYIRLVG